MIAPGTDIHGFFLDGQNPVQHPARIALAEGVLRFQTLGQAKPVHWDFAEIDWDGTRLFPDQLRIKHHDPDDSWLIVTDTAMITATMAGKKIWARHNFWVAHRELLTITRATAATFLVCVALWVSWPYLTEPLADFIPNNTRDWFSDTTQSVLGLKQECRAPEGMAALQQITDALTAGNPELRHAKIVVVNTDMLNALTLANDKILVTRALITKAESSDAIAGMIAHELGHVAHRHILRSMLGQFTLKLLVMIFTGTHGEALGYANDITALTHSRNFEAEADATAIELLRRAHISTHGFGNFFNYLQQETTRQDGVVSRYFSTHPPSEERAQKMLKIEIPDAKPALSAEAWQALQHICGTPSRAVTVPETKDAPRQEPDAPAIEDTDGHDI